MKVSETKTVEREIHVATCLKCGGNEIRLHDCGYWEGNTGGGTCKSCGAEVLKSCGPEPSVDTLAAIWNGANDIETLIVAEQTKIADATIRIAELNAIRAKHCETQKPLE